MQRPLLEIDALSISFRTDSGQICVVEDVSFAIGTGENVGLVGESGCGKTVTAMAIMGLNPSPPSRVDSGRILLDGRDLLALGPAMRDIRGNRIVTEGRRTAGSHARRVASAGATSLIRRRAFSVRG